QRSKHGNRPALGLGSEPSVRVLGELAGGAFLVEIPESAEEASPLVVKGVRKPRQPHGPGSAERMQHSGRGDPRQYRRYPEHHPAHSASSTESWSARSSRRRSEALIVMTPPSPTGPRS